LFDTGTEAVLASGSWLTTPTTLEVRFIVGNFNWRENRHQLPTKISRSRDLDRIRSGFGISTCPRLTLWSQSKIGSAGLAIFLVLLALERRVSAQSAISACVSVPKWVCLKVWGSGANDVISASVEREQSGAE
jgi:hypothetical protein